MSKTSILLNLIIVLMISLFDKTYEECVCSVRVRGQYCGTELNRRNGNSDCKTNSMYFCGDGNEGRVPKLMLECKDQYECEQNQFVVTARARRRNPCRLRFKCKCPSSLRRGLHCGSQLVGDDCPSDMLFQCRSRNRISPQDYCPDGCNSGRCLIGVGDENIQARRGNDQDTSDDESDREP